MEYDRVFILGIDGAGNGVKDVKTPHLHRIFDQGMYTYSAKAVYPSSSGENWGSLFHGVVPQKHKITNETAGTCRYPEDSAYPSFMKLARQSWPNCSLASFSRWEPINYGIIEQSCACHLVSDDELKIVSEIDKYMGKVDPKILFVHLDLVDDAGHSFGYWTNEFYRSIQTADYLVGQIIDTICRQRLDNGSLIIACSDHGGGGCAPNEHGCDDPKDMTIFWGCMSPSRKVGAVINSDMSITDTAAVVVSALGLERPREWDAVVPRPLINHGLI